MMTGRTGSGGGVIESLSDVKPPAASLANVFVERHQISQQKTSGVFNTPEVFSTGLCCFDLDLARPDRFCFGDVECQQAVGKGGF